MTLSNRWREKKKIIKRYDMTAHIYELRYREEQNMKYDAVLNSSEITMGDCILDVGCGTGLFIQKIAEKNGIIVGIDSSKKMLEEAKRACNRLKNASFICGDADFLPLRGRIFDNVFAFTLLQNMPQPKQTILEIARVAKNDSEIILTYQKKRFKEKHCDQSLENAGLHVSKFFDDGQLKDYVVIYRRCSS